MKTTDMVRYISILGVILTILTVIVALLKTGGDGTSVIVVLISSFLFIAASINPKNLQKKS